MPNKKTVYTFDADKEYELIARYVTRKTVTRLSNIKVEFLSDFNVYGPAAALRQNASEMIKLEELVVLSASLLSTLSEGSATRLADVYNAIDEMRKETEKKLIKRNPFDTGMSTTMHRAVYEEKCSALHAYHELLTETLSQLNDLRVMLQD